MWLEYCQVPKIRVLIPIFRKRPQSTDRGRQQHKQRQGTCVRAHTTYTPTLPYTLTLLPVLVHSRPASYAAPLCTYIRAGLIQVSGHIGFITVPLPIFRKRPRSVRPAATQVASLCIYIRAWLIQMFGHVWLIHQHCHRPRIRSLVDQCRNTGTGGKSPTGTPLIILSIQM